MIGKIYAIVGATGHIGHHLAAHLLKKGHRVRAIGRDQKKLDAIKAQGADILKVNDFTHPDNLAEIFKGADALFSLIPPDYTHPDYAAYQEQVGEAIKTAIQQSPVRYVLNLSSVGAQLPEGTGPIAQLAHQEKRLNTLANVHTLHLRPGYFMENLLRFLPMIKQSGILGTPLRHDLPISMIATQDIGAKAAEFLEELNFKGHSAFELFGPASYTLPEAAALIGQVLGKPNLKYVQLSYAEAEQAMRAIGLPFKTIAMMIEMYKAFNDELIKPVQKITDEHRGTTTLDQFIQTIKLLAKK